MLCLASWADFLVDIIEKNYDPSGQSSDSQFVIDNFTYSDLDELIVRHVHAMSRRVEELMAHDRFKPGSEDELREWICASQARLVVDFLSPDLFLKNQLLANPAKSMYGFSLNRKKPGHFNLSFLANKDSTVQTWVSPLYK